MILKRVLLLGLVAFMAMSFGMAHNNRIRQNINRDWKFERSDVHDASQTDFDDTRWDTIHLPHSFSMPYFMGSQVYQGYGWYRKEIIIRKEWKDKHINLEFEGAFIEKEVYVNGAYVGKHVGGYTGFNFDITPYVKVGVNKIAVRVNNLWNPRVAPRAGDHQFSGGIYRDVYLNVTNKLHVDNYGTFVSTPQVTRNKAVCQVETTVLNSGSKRLNATVKTDIVDKEGKLVASVKSIETIDKGAVKHLNQILPTIEYPHLWSPESPYLYKALTTIYANGKAVDNYETSFGIRTFEWSADDGFSLNGEHYYLLGTNVHQDQAGWGDAVTNAAMRRDVQMMKEAGFNCIRGSHYPHDPAFSQACDELGMILFQENAFWGMGGSSGDRGWGGDGPSSSCYPPNPLDQLDFDQSVLQQLKEMIQIHRNSASIAAWSLSNEPFFTDNSTDEAMKNLLNIATDSARVWDPTRQVAIGGAQRKGVDNLGKGAIAFYNGDGATLYEHPNFPNLVSEYGSTIAQRPGNFVPGWGDLAHDGKDGMYRPKWRSGQIIWCGFDHGTVGGVALASMGLVDYFRIPKRQYYWYQLAYKEGQYPPVEPQWAKQGIPAKLRLESSNTTILNTDGTDDCQLLVTVLDAQGSHISNEIPIELVVISGPGEFPTGKRIKFMPPSESEESDITIRDGMAAISFRSYYAGKTIIRAISEGLASAEIEITTLGEPVWVEGVSKESISRPYHRFKVQESISSEVTELLLATNRPCWVSSTSKDTSKAYANDGDISTIWRPSSEDKASWWKLALEADYCIRQIELEFSEECQHHFSIEVSADDIHWDSVVEDNLCTKSHLYTADFGCNIAFIRILFHSDEAGLAEVKVGGIPSALTK